MKTKPELSIDQESALHTILQWRERFPLGKQDFRLAGLAGTGKTTLIRELADIFPQCMVMAPTGKAANNLQKKGVPCTTIHSAIYNAVNDGHGKCWFKRKPKIDAKTVIVDEASMVAMKEYRSLMDYGIPIVWVGDHGQLEAIGENPKLMESPDIALEKIHRQAEDNPILRLAMAFREDRPVPYWRDPQGRCEIVYKNQFLANIGDRQAIVGTNKTRVELNERLRAARGLKGNPKPGDKIIVRKNNARFMVFNGQQAKVLDVYSTRRGVIELQVEMDDERVIVAPFLLEQFGNPDRIETQETSVLIGDYGDSLTGHLTQGSEYPHVIVLDEISRGWDKRRWRYTTTTRASESIIYCR